MKVTRSPGGVEGRIRRQLGDLVALAFPLCVGHLGQQLMNIVDTAVLGRYSDAAMAGAGLGGSILFAFTVVGIGIIMGMDTLVPQSLGAGEAGRARELYAAGVRLALVLTVPLSALVAGVAFLLPWSGIHPAVAAEGAEYLFARLPGIAPMLLYAAMRSYLQANHITRPMVLAMVIANIVNLAADWVLVFGDPALERIGLPGIGLPPLGAFGAGIATTAVSYGSILVCGLAVRSFHRSSGERPARATGAERRAHLGAIMHMGLPVGLQLLAEVGVFALTGTLAGTMGRLPAAGHQVAIVLASLSFSAAIGITAATSVQVGRAVGAGDPRAARRAGALAMVVGAVVMGTAGLAFVFFPYQLAALFTSDPVLQSAAAPLLRIAAVFQMSDAIQAVSAGALRGAGATRFTFVANVIGHYAIGFPIAVLLGLVLDMGAEGLWWGLSFGLTGVAVAQSLRFRQLTATTIGRA